MTVRHKIKGLSYSKEVLVIIFAVPLLITTGFYFGLKSCRQPLLSQPLTIEQKQQSTTEKNLSCRYDCGGNYQDENLTFKTLDGWETTTRYNGNLAYYFVYGKQDSSSSQITLDIRIENWGIPQGQIASMSDKEVIEENKNWRASSRSDIGGFNPQQIEKIETLVNNKPAIKYVFRLDGEGDEFAGKVKPLTTWYMLHHQNSLVWLSFSDTQQNVIDQFLQDFVLNDNSNNN